MVLHTLLPFLSMFQCLWTLRDVELRIDQWLCGEGVGGVYRETSVCLFVQSDWSIIYVLIKFSNVFITLIFEMDNPPGCVSVFCQCEYVCMSEWYTFIQSRYVKLSAVYVSRLIGTWSRVLTKINHCNYTECNYVFFFLVCSNDGLWLHVCVHV